MKFKIIFFNIFYNHSRFFGISNIGKNIYHYKTRDFRLIKNYFFKSSKRFYLFFYTGYLDWLVKYREYDR